MTAHSKQTGTWIVWILFLTAFFEQGIAFIQANAQTIDESNHLVAGYAYLTTGDFRLNREHPPFIKMLSALLIFLWHRIPFEPDVWPTAKVSLH